MPGNDVNTPLIAVEAKRFPPWIRRPWPHDSDTKQVRETLAALSLNTVCVSARCPNQGECWRRGTATFMALGANCTRNCAFCGVTSGVPSPPDPSEPDHIAAAVDALALRHAVVTSVTRDDLPDGGARHFADIIRAIRRRCPQTAVEVLTPDFQGDIEALRVVVEAAPEVFAHNIETVSRLHKRLRDPRASYERSLHVLRRARETLPVECFVKSGLMVGCGETEAEVAVALADLRAAGCDAVVIGQYLKPGPGHVEVAAFIPPEQFDEHRRQALSLGFRFVMAGPFVRSSYRAETLTAVCAAAEDPARCALVSPHPSNLA